MARQFKPVRFFVIMGVLAFLVCGVTAFLTHRAAHGNTEAERSAYTAGERAGEQAEAGAKLPTDAALHSMAQDDFARKGSGEPMAWKSAFARGYTEGFEKTHHAR